MSLNAAKNHEHDSLPLSEEDSFSDDSIVAGDVIKQSCTSRIFYVVIGIVIGIGTSALTGVIRSPSEENTIIAGNFNNSMWLVEDVTISTPLFFLTLGSSPEEKCESQGSNRVWVVNDEDSKKGKCLGRCGYGNMEGADEDNRGSGSSGYDACGKHNRCCHHEISLIISPDGIDSCVCWESTLIQIIMEESSFWD